MSSKPSFWFLSVPLLACSHRSSDASDQSQALVQCPQVLERRPLGATSDPNLTELSGLASHSTRDDSIWAQSDESPAVYAVDLATGRVVSEVQIVGPTRGDFEDLARLGSRLFLLDGGSNRLQKQISVWALPETQSSTVSAERMEVQVKGKDEFETLLADPRSNHLFVVEKAKHKTKVCDLGTFVPGREVTPECATIDLGLVSASGGAISPDGSLVVLRNEQQAWIWSRARGTSLFDTLRTPGCPVAALATPSNSDECNGEAVTFSRDGRSLISGSESTKDCPKAHLHLYPLK